MALGSVLAEPVSSFVHVLVLILFLAALLGLIVIIIVVVVLVVVMHLQRGRCGAQSLPLPHRELHSHAIQGRLSAAFHLNNCCIAIRGCRSGRCGSIDGTMELCPKLNPVPSTTGVSQSLVGCGLVVEVWCS